eukprot:TRINITY_DN1805_c0_g1_i1.p1 TRINITY_DN1805_c0_g1~~TRINITY_DN1805_c0_g1_i1.p1  ORF type:complete len:1585 (-),score=213.01 TRINITY_DN1805_c0_g1_i1:7673-12427(-)
MQQDIDYQRAQNIQFKEELAEKEQEKGDIALDIKESEETVEKLKMMCENLMDKLKETEEELDILESKYRENTGKLKEIEDEIEVLGEKERVGEITKTDLRENLDRILADRNDLIAKMNELAEKYELYVKTLNQEREDIVNTNNKHTKLLVGAGLLTVLEKGVIRRLGLSIHKMKLMARYRRETTRSVMDLAKWRERYRKSLLEAKFSKWRHSVLDWSRERRINLELIERKRKKAILGKYFDKWHNDYTIKTSLVQRHMEAARQTLYLRKLHSLKQMRRLFQKWRKVSLNLVKRDRILKKLLLKKYKKVKGNAMTQWIYQAKAYSQSRKFKELSETMAVEKFKRSMFARFRHNVLLEEDSKVANAQVVLEKAQVEKGMNRFLKAATVIFINENKKNKENLKAEAYNAFKYNRVAEIKERARQQLDEYEPECKEMDSNISQMRKEQDMKKKERVLRVSLLIFRRRLRYYMEKWYNMIPIYDQNANTLARIIARWQRNKVKGGLDAWYKRIHQTKMHENRLIEDSTIYEINQLAERNKELDKALQTQELHLRNITESKLRRVANIIKRKAIRIRIAQWKQATDWLRNVKTAVENLAKLSRKHKLSQGMQLFLGQTKLTTLALGREYKENAVKSKMNRVLLKRSLSALKASSVHYKNAKKNLKKTLKSLILNKKYRFIERWRQHSHASRKQAIHQENERLYDEIEAISGVIAKGEEKLKNTTEILAELNKKEKSQTVLAIFKRLALNRLENMKSALRYWKNRVFLHKSRQLLLRRYLNKYSQNTLRVALQIWKRNAFHTRIEQIQAELKTELRKYDTIARLSAIKLDEADAESRQLKEMINQVRSQHGIDEKRTERAISILYRLKKFYIRHGFHNNFFLAWAEMYKREKMLQGQAKIITQTYVGKHIYAKLKAESQRRKTQELIAKEWEKVFSRIAHLHEKWALNRWRSATQTTKKDITQTEINKQGEQLVELEDRVATIKAHAYSKYEMEILKRRKLKVLQALRRQVDVQKMLKRKTVQLQNTLRFMRIDKSFGRWHGDTIQLDLIHEKELKAEEHFSKLFLKRAMIKWKQSYFQGTALPKVLDKVSKRQYLNFMGESLEKIAGFCKRIDQLNEESKTKGATKMLSTLDKAHRTRISEALAFLQMYSQWTKLDKELLKRVILKCLKRKVSAALLQWLAKAERTRLAADVEARGETAQAVSEMIRRHDSLRKVIAEEKLEESLEKSREKSFADVSPIRLIPMSTSSDFGKRAEEIKKADEELSFATKPLSPRPERRREVMQKFLKMWVRSAKGQGLKEKYITYWRSWLQIRKLIEQTASFILKRLINGEKAWAWDKLKNLKRAALKAFERVPRTVLLNKIEDSTKNLLLLEQEKENLENNIRVHEAQNMARAVGYAKGKRIAAGVLAKLMQASLNKWFMRWKITSQRLLVDDLSTVLEKKLSAFERLQDINMRLTEKNRALLSEGEELRQASMDGLEIANLIQEIAQEREQLSVDLANRSLTIKKLVEENASLQQRLDQAQVETENLVKLTRGLQVQSMILYTLLFYIIVQYMQALMNNSEKTLIQAITLNMKESMGKPYKYAQFNQI